MPSPIDREEDCFACQQTRPTARAEKMFVNSTTHAALDGSIMFLLNKTQGARPSFLATVARFRLWCAVWQDQMHKGNGANNFPCIVVQPSASDDDDEETEAKKGQQSPLGNERPCVDQASAIQGSQSCGRRRFFWRIEQAARSNEAADWKAGQARLSSPSFSPDGKTKRATIETSCRAKVVREPRARHSSAGND
ncbi:hypothetical protein HPB51_017039 [Rhipicephalus microplus]|uniref:Uncharacterized protein n=1 Tax=Rhipicephalus microplus TaxID=6941 RepID=A0A9J6F474_RHIMP|nr:hypothetical protein HPB51_017039 [Rhipicephalus microplus]